MSKKEPESLKIGRLRSSEELRELKRRREERMNNAAKKLQEAVAEARRRGIPLHVVLNERKQ